MFVPLFLLGSLAYFLREWRLGQWADRQCDKLLDWSWAE